MTSVRRFKEDLMNGESPALMKKVSNQNKNLRKRFDDEVIAKQSHNKDVMEMYKPITDTQQEQIAKTDALFQQLLTDLGGKHDHSSRQLHDIIRGLARSQSETRKQGLDIISSIVRQPLLQELISELQQKYPSLVKKISQPGLLRDLSEEEQRVLEPLNHLSNNDM